MLLKCLSKQKGGFDWDCVRVCDFRQNIKTTPTSSDPPAPPLLSSCLTLTQLGILLCFINESQRKSQLL